jgi:hypothetical protein
VISTVLLPDMGTAEDRVDGDEEVAHRNLPWSEVQRYVA